MKKIGMFLLSLIFVLTLSACFDQDDSQSGDYHYQVTAGRATITKYTGDESDITLPSQLNGVPVIKLGEDVFNGSESLESITALNHALGKHSLANIDTLREVHLSAEAMIEGTPLSGSNHIETITIPGNYRLRDYYGSSISDIPRSIQTIIVADGTQSLTHYLFTGAVDLNKIELPSSLITIRSNAFEDLEVHTISFADDLALGTLESNAFVNIGYVNTVKFGENASFDTIKTGTFSDLNGLETVILPRSVTHIQEGTFKNNQTLETLVLNHELGVVELATFEHESDHPFYQASPSFSVYVPDHLLEDYQENSAWLDVLAFDQIKPVSMLD